MVKCGVDYTFNIEDISLLDINDLIDKGKRFSLSMDLEECDDLGEVLKDGDM